jgi:hypothetical protein
MSLDALIMFSGFLVALLPFLGFPNRWDAIILFVIGLFIVMLGIVVRRRRKDVSRGGQRTPGQGIVNTGAPVAHE